MYVEAKPDGSGLAFSRVPGPDVDADVEADADSSRNADGSSNAESVNTSTATRSNAASGGAPMHVSIPGTTRPPATSPSAGLTAPSSSGSSAEVNGSQPAAGRKFDPMAKKSTRPSKAPKPPKGSSSQSLQPAAADLQTELPSAAAAAAASNVSRSSSSSSMSQAGHTNGLDVADGQSSSLPVNSLDEAVAGHLDPDNLPSFLKTPRRRDDQDTLPTCAE